MGKIKGWKKVRIIHQPRPREISWIVAQWESDKDEELILSHYKIDEHYNLQVISNGLYAGRGKFFKTKKEALEYAYDYMRNGINL